MHRKKSANFTENSVIPQPFFYILINIKWLILTKSGYFTYR